MEDLIMDKDITPLVIASINKIHKINTPIMIIIFMFTLNVFLSAIAAMLVDTDPTFSNFISFAVAFPLLGIFVIFVMVDTLRRNLQMSAYTLHSGIVITYLVFIVILSIWLIIELAWYCPTFKPLHCTDGNTTMIKNSYLFFIIMTWIQMVLVLVERIMFAGLKKKAVMITNNISGISKENFTSMLAQQSQAASILVKGIGDKYQGIADKYE